MRLVSKRHCQAVGIGAYTAAPWARPVYWLRRKFEQTDTLIMDAKDLQELWARQAW